ncbi:MAG: TolB-like 6-bladed beta-propeller domain-containing protein [Clostridiales bacterium]|jgi:hypothetical protein|nr:TolB-like 6-bladed beta-propeller domain-containing protein [Clostridiales bacterium]
MRRLIESLLVAACVIVAWGLLNFSLISCGKYTEQIVRYQVFPEEIHLKAESVPLDTAVLFRYPYRVKVREGLAIVMDLHHTDHYFHAFTYPEWKHLVSFGKRGEGPEDMLLAETFQFNSLDSLWTLDPNKRQITRWRLSPEACSAERVEEIALDEQLVRTLDFYMTDTGFIVPSYLGIYRYHLLNFQGKILRSEGHIPTENTSPDISRPALAQAWRSFMDYHPQNDLLVMVTQLGEVLEFMHLGDSTHTVLYGPHGEPEFRAVQNEAIPTGIRGFSDVQLTDNYMYAVFHGRTFKEIQAAYQKGEKPEGGGRFIYVFDLAGNPVRKYILDRSICGIDVDELTHTITATDVNSNEPLIQFKM